MRARPSTRGSVIRRRRLDSVSVTEARHGPEADLPLHAHPVACAVLVVAGEFVESVEDRVFRCRPGDVVFRPADSAHVNRYGGRGARYLVVEIPDRLLAAREGGHDLRDRVRVFRSARAGALMEALRADDGRPDHAGSGSAESDALILELLNDALPRARERRGAPLHHALLPGWLPKIRARLRTEFRSPPSVAELAAGAGVHPDHVSRSFRRRYGFTITELTRRLRIEHAARAIRSSRRGLARIALEAGFSDQSHMTRQMKRYLGITPHQLRRLASPDT